MRGSDVAPERVAILDSSGCAERSIGWFDTGARVARIACHALPAVPATSARPTRAAVVRVARCRRAYFENRYRADGGHASTGRSVRCRITSAAKSLAVS